MRPPSAIAASRIADKMTPLSETLGDPRLEAAAAILVVTMAERADTWGVVTGMQALGAFARATVRPEYSGLRSMTAHPNFSGLVEEGFARWSDSPGDNAPDISRRRPIAFTEAGLIAIGATEYTEGTADYE